MKMLGEKVQPTVSREGSKRNKDEDRRSSCIPCLKEGRTEKDFTLRRTFAETVELICEESTAHGIAHIWHNRFNYLGLFWFVVVVILFFCMGNSVIETTSLLSRNGLQVPSIALCNRAYFSRRKLKALNISSPLTNYLYGITGTVTAVNQGFLQNATNSRYMTETHAELMATLKEKNLTFRELVDALSYDCEDILLMCSVAMRRMSREVCCKNMHSIPTFSAKCYIFFTNDTHRQMVEGEYLGVSLYLRVDPDDYPVLDPEIMDMSHFLKTGLQISVFSNQTHPALPSVGQGVSILPGIYTTAEVSLSVVNVEGKKTIFDRKEKECAPASTISYKGDPDLFYRVQPNCQFHSIRTCLLAETNCSHYALDNNPGDLLPPCSLEELQNFYAPAAQSITFEEVVTEAATYRNQRQILDCLESEQNKCRDSCVRNDFQHATSHIPIYQDVYDNLHKKFNLTNKSELAAVTIFYPTMRYTDVRVWRETLSDLVSEIGGITGLLLGISIVSMIEVVVAVTLFLNIMIRNAREKFSQRIRPLNS